MPELSVLLASHDDARYVGSAVESILAQTFRDLELIVVDDASTDETQRVLEAVADTRLRVLRNDEQSGLAASLNRGLDEVRGRYVARLDADDVALPDRFAQQLKALRRSGAAVLGTAIRDLDDRGTPGRLHRMAAGSRAVRWHALFSSPFFHPTVLVNRDALGDLRYDTDFLESEDYDLWTRLLATGAEGGNLAEALVHKRVHAGQASLRRRDVQRSFQRRVALREIAHVADVDAEAAWSFAIGLSTTAPSAAAYRELLAAFEAKYGVDAEVRTAAARRLARAGRVLSAARLYRQARRGSRVVVVSPEPTPYRAPLLDRIARRVDLTVIYAARTVASRTWEVTPEHRSVYLHGFDLPGAHRILRHSYPVTPDVFRELREADPDVVVVSGWSTFASQAAIGWCRARGVPYVLHVESHDLDPRPGWRRAVKGAVVPHLVREASSVLAVGTAARESVIARGASPERVRIFANTIDVPAWIARADRLAAHRGERRGDTSDDVVVLSVARLVHEKGLDLLIRAVAAAGDPRLHLVLVGQGPAAGRLRDLADRLGVRLTLRGELAEDELAEDYVDADVFALLSLHEPWGVVVNEAAASGLPLVLSERVGAARDLLRDGENGLLVRAGDVDAAALALRSLAADPDLRRAFGARSRELVRGWDYEPSVEGFLAAVREARTAR